jgi:hypothetical protein
LKLPSLHFPAGAEVNNEKPIHESWSPGGYLNPRPIECEAAVLPFDERVATFKNILYKQRIDLKKSEI